MKWMKRLLSTLMVLSMIGTSALSEQAATPSDITPPGQQESEQPEKKEEASPSAGSENPAPENPAPENPEPEKPVWDESQCDHANFNCVNAPACDKEGCEHIGKDANGLPYPLCQKGRWVLDQQDKLTRQGKPVMMMAMVRSVRSQNIDLNLADATIYRSGSYTVSGGNLRPGAHLTVAEDRVVVLDLRDVTLGTLTLGTNADLTVTLRGNSRMDTLDAAKKSAVQFKSGGALAIGQVKRPGGSDDASFTVTGGSVNAATDERKGRQMFAFDAAGITGVTVNGNAYAATSADQDGKCYLWLSAPQAGQKWQGEVNGTVLEVKLVSSLPQTGATALSAAGGGQETLHGGTSYSLTGSFDQAKTFTADGDGAALMMDGVGDPGKAGSVDAGAHTLEIDLTNANTLGSLKAGALTVQGTGSLYAGTLNADSLTLGSGALHFGSSAGNFLSGLISLDAGSSLDNVTKLTVDGAQTPLLSSGSTLYLPASFAGKSLIVTSVSGDTVTVAAAGAQTAMYSLSATKDVQAGNAASFDVRGTGAYVTGTVSASGATANAAFHDVMLTNKTSVLFLSDENLTVNFTGDNALAGPDGGQAISLAGQSSLTLRANEGRLLLRSQSDTNGLTLLGNVKIEPEPTLPHTRLLIKDKSGNPVLNTPVTLRLKGETYQFTTHYDGSVYLWGMGQISDADVAVRSGEEVYTAVIMKGEADVTAGLTISNVTAQDQGDGTAVITFDCPGAKSVGVQYLVGTSGQKFADAFVPEAQRAQGQGGRVIVSGLAGGQVLSYRVYASGTENATLTADTDDGFQFSDVYTLTCLEAWKPADPADKEYTGKAYENPLKLPQGATVSYSGDNLNKDGLPVKIGDYVMHVTIPAGDAVYRAGVYDVNFKVTKIELTILPEPNQEKYVGDNDPEAFYYDVKGLLKGDEVTGVLTRKKGEDVGNYAFVLTSLKAADYYHLVLAKNAHTFTILPGEPAPGMPPVFYEMLHPVRQEIVRGDKRTVAVVLNTQDVLTVTHSVIGHVMFDSKDQQMRPFSPSLSWNKSTDEVLLRLHAEAELNKDGGYVTDDDGQPIYGGRFARMSWLTLRNLHTLGVDALSVNNRQAALTVRLQDFLTKDMEQFVKDHGGDLKQVKFALYVEPVEKSENAAEQAALEAAAPVAGSWRMRVALVVNNQEIDATGVLPSLLCSVDMEPVATMLNGMKLYDEEKFSAQYTLLRLSAGESGEFAQNRMNAAFVTPFLPEEAKTAQYPCLMYADRYLVSPLGGEGLICVASR